MIIGKLFILLQFYEQRQWSNYKYYMREHMSQHKIIPVKCLLENDKQIKRQFQTFVPKQTNNGLAEPIVTPKAYPYHNTQRLGLPLREYPVSANQPSSKQHLKGISVGKKVSMPKALINQYQKQTFIQSPSPQFEEYYAVKRDQKPYQHSKQNFEFDKNIKSACQIDNARKSQNFSINEQLNAKMRVEKKDSIKYGYFNRLSEQIQKNISRTNEKSTNKYQQQVWNMSTYEKSTFNERKENHSIFKDDLSKIKTDLFQKEAFLIEKNKQLERKEGQIKEITMQLQSNMSLSDNMKKRIDCLMSQAKDSYEVNQRLMREKEQIQKLYQQKHKKIQQQLKTKEQIIINLRNNQSKKNEQYQQSLQDHQSNLKLLNLKIRQFECEEKQLNQIISNLKQKQKRTTQNYEIKINGISQILRQKQDQLKQLHNAATLDQSSLFKMQQLRNKEQKEYLKDINQKESAIRQLSEEVSDLKDNLRTVEIRMRQMIENEEQLKKQIDKKNNFSDKSNDKRRDQLKTTVNVLTKEVEAKTKEITVKDNQIRKLAHQNEGLKNQINEHIELKNQYISLSNDHLKKIRQLESLICTQTLEGKLIDQKTTQIREKYELHQTSSSAEQKTKEQLFAAKDLLNECRQKLAQKQIELCQLKMKYQEQQQLRLPGNSKQRQLNLLKPRFCKLLSQNQRLSIIVKELNYKLQQFYHTNCDLNNEIIEKDLLALNKRMMEKC